MSYILDALRKADAQRERDASRGIHAQPAAMVSGGRSAKAGPRLLGWGALGGGVAVIALAGWYFTRSPQPEPPVASAPGVARSDAANVPAAPVAMLPPGVSSPSQSGAVPAIAAAPVISPPPSPRERPAPAPAAPPMRGLPQTNVVPQGPVPGVSESQRAAAAREQAFAARAGSTPQPAAPAAAPVPAPGATGAPPVAQAPAPAAVPAPAAPAATPATATTGLPADAPRIAISGGVYSQSPAQRMLIVNGQVFSEGSEIAPGVTVEQIQPRTAILRYRDARYTVAY